MDYDTWGKVNHPLSNLDRQMIKAHISELKYKPKISIVMPVYNTRSGWLKRAFESVLSQIYTNWELCVCDDGSNLETKAILASYESRDERIKIKYSEMNQGGAEATNEAIRISTGDYVAQLDSDDELMDDSIYYIVITINEYPNIKFIYTDNILINDKNDIVDTFYKPDWSPDLFYSQCFPADFAVFESKLIKSLMMRQVGGSHDYDLLLRALEVITPKEIYHIPETLYRYRVHSTSLTVQDESRAVFGAVNALREHLERRGVKAKVLLDWPWYRVKYDLPTPAPSVAILIASINKNGLLFKCLDRFLGYTDYPNYRIYLCIPDRVKNEVISYRRQFITSGLIKIINQDESVDFSYSNIINRLVAECDEEVVCLFNDDIEPISDGWLTEMVSHAMRPGVGLVGAKLLYPNMTIQHAGVVCGIGGTAYHVWKQQPYDASGYWGRAKLIGNFSVVTGACSVIKRDRFLDVGGFEEELREAYNDVDFCLKLLREGYYNVYTPYATLVHRESATRGFTTTQKKVDKLQQETNLLRNKWLNILLHDPFYNPHLSLEDGNFATSPISRLDKPWNK